MKIVGIHFSYDKKFSDKENFGKKLMVMPYLTFGIDPYCHWQERYLSVKGL